MIYKCIEDFEIPVINENGMMADCIEVLDILCEYILPSYPDAVHWFLDKVVGNNEYNILPLKQNENILGVAITKDELLCTFVLKKNTEVKGMVLGL